MPSGIHKNKAGPARRRASRPGSLIGTNAESHRLGSVAPHQPGVSFGEALARARGASSASAGGPETSASELNPSASGLNPSADEKADAGRKARQTPHYLSGPTFSVSSPDQPSSQSSLLSRANLEAAFSLGGTSLKEKVNRAFPTPAPPSSSSYQSVSNYCTPQTGD